jgi:hypothetical protein
MLLWQSDDAEQRWRSAPIPVDTPVDLAPVARLVRAAAVRGCVLLARDGVRVNGMRCLPLQVLHDRDEICAAGKRFYFSVDALPEVSVFRSHKTVRCARCLGLLADGEQVVRCPGCSAHHHPGCWDHGGSCQKCRRSASGVAWTPDAGW